MEWQMLEPNEWVFGTKVRGVVRKPCADVYLDEERDPEWIWFLNGGKVRGSCCNLVDAIEAAEEALKAQGLLR